MRGGGAEREREGGKEGVKSSHTIGVRERERERVSEWGEEREEGGFKSNCY